MKLPKELTTVTKTSKTLAFIVFITLPFLGFFAGMNYQSSLNSASQTSTTEPILLKRIPTPTPPQTFDTSNWRTYTNSILQIAIRYPMDWNINDFVKDFVVLKNYSSTVGGDKNINGLYQMHISSEKKANSISKVKTELLKEKANDGNYYRAGNFYVDGKSVNKVRLFVKNEQEKEINGYNALYREVSYSSPQNPSHAEVYIFDGKTKVIKITQEQDVSGGKALFNQILQTFKFTNP